MTRWHVNEVRTVGFTGLCERFQTVAVADTHEEAILVLRRLGMFHPFRRYRIVREIA